MKRQWPRCRTAVILFTSILICLYAVSCPSPALAEPCAKAVPLMAGDPAPCDGVLYPEALVKEHLRLRVDFEEISKKLAIEQDLHSKDLATYRLKLDAADRDLARLSNPPWYDRPEINRWMGFGLGVVLSVATAFAVAQVAH